MDNKECVLRESLKLMVCFGSVLVGLWEKSNKFYVNFYVRN